MPSILKCLARKDLEGKRFLDIGLANEWVMPSFLNSGAQSIVGIEVANDDVRTARSSLADERVTFMVGSVIKLPFKDCSFNTVVAWEVERHVPQGAENSMFSDVFRVLQPGGAFYLPTPTGHAVSDALNQKSRWMLGQRQSPVDNIRRLAAENGFAWDNIEGGSRLSRGLTILRRDISGLVLRRLINEGGLTRASRDNSGKPRPHHPRWQRKGNFPEETVPWTETECVELGQRRAPVGPTTIEICEGGSSRDYDRCRAVARGARAKVD
jgi:SAM-dependent methyltransferase